MVLSKSVSRLGSIVYRPGSLAVIGRDWGRDTSRVAAELEERRATPDASSLVIDG